MWELKDEERSDLRDDGTPGAEHAVDIVIALAQSLHAKLIFWVSWLRQVPSHRQKDMGLETALQTQQRLEAKIGPKVRTGSGSMRA
jgi:hypothetical protein